LTIRTPATVFTRTLVPARTAGTNSPRSLLRLISAAPKRLTFLVAIF
jgi:hypothetical protein